MTDKRLAVALQFRKAIELLVQAMPLDEAEALSIADLYEQWAADMQYKPGMIVKYGEDSNGDAVLYSVLTAHTSQSDWTPDKSASLFKRIGFTDSGIPLWVQPLGAADAYAKGDVVSYNGTVWISDVDANVWIPGVYGWSLKK